MEEAILLLRAIEAHLVLEIHPAILASAIIAILIGIFRVIHTVMV
jgi:hypothetical protein